jgi:hypothetical protein
VRSTSRGRKGTSGKSPEFSLQARPIVYKPDVITHDREDETLAKLERFRSGLHKVRKEAGPEPEKEVEAYHGQVLEDTLDGDDDDADDRAWFAGKLKFKKHIDDAYRGGDGRKADDYVTIPSKHAKPTKQR